MNQLQLLELQEKHSNFTIRHVVASPWDALDQVNWDFTGETTQYLTHTFHSYPARFIPQIPNLFIQLFTKEGDVVFDPFSGCGTTLVEAMFLNRSAVGVDMNPLASLITKSKTTLITKEDVEQIGKMLVEVQRIFGLRESEEVEYLTQRGDFDNTDMKFPNRKISELFTPEIMAELKMIKEQIDQLAPYPNAFNLSLVALSATIRVVIESERKNDFVRVFRQKINSMLKLLNETATRVDVSKSMPIQGDARKVSLASCSVDLVVTSPPYVNALDYYRVHQYNMAWLGMDYHAFQRQEIGGHSHFIANRFRLLGEYLGDMLRAMLEMNRVLKPQGVSAIVVGNSSLEYELIEGHKFFTAMAPDAGFEVKRVLFRNIDVTRKYHAQNIGKINNEHIVVLQKNKASSAKADDDDFIANVVKREMIKFKKLVEQRPGSSTRGKHVLLKRLKQNPQRLADAIATIEKDVRIKQNGRKT